MPSSKRERSSQLQSTPSPSERESLDNLAAEGDFVDRTMQEDEEGKPVLQPGRITSAPELDLGTRLRDTRESKHITQGELATLTASLDVEEKGVSRAVISLYEKGVNRPSPKELRLLCEALRITPNFLIYGDEHPFDSSLEYERLGTIARRSDAEGFAWMAYVMANTHHNHYDAVMKLVLDLQRGWDKGFDKGLQERANEHLLEMAERLKLKLSVRKEKTR